jgi:propanol-preferring alcohol dehydrogenase
MVLPSVVSLSETDQPLRMAELPDPQPKPGEVLLRVSACGVCHTDLDEIEGRTTPPQLPVVLGHEAVGRVAQLGPGVTKWKVGDRVGIGWIHSSTGSVDENLSPKFRATGRDVHGGYAELMTVPEEYAYAIPELFSDEQAAPLLCAGAVGYRSLKLTALKDGDRLGLMGFGGSAHLVLQVAQHVFPRSPIYVFARSQAARDFAVRLGALWAGDIADRSPEPLHAMIDTTPAWKPIIEALANLTPGGRLVINAIRKEDNDKKHLLRLSYHEHLWMEREIKTVANVTRYDLAEFLPLAAEIPIQPHVTTYSLKDANRALLDLWRGGVKGANVLKI